jgi:hypothetical protein
MFLLCSRPCVVNTSDRIIVISLRLPECAGARPEGPGRSKLHNSGTLLVFLRSCVQITRHSTPDTRHRFIVP